MRRRLLATFLVLDGLCAVALPALGAFAAGPAPSATYVEVAGACVETRTEDGREVGGLTVPMTFCGD